MDLNKRQKDAAHPLSVASTVKCRPYYPQQSHFLMCGVSQMQSENTPKRAMNISHKMLHFNVPLHSLVFIYTYMCMYREQNINELVI